MVLNLDPKANKKRKPSKLKPLEPAKTKTGKIAGNFAAEVLAQLDANDKIKAKQRSSQFKSIDKDVSAFLNFS